MKNPTDQNVPSQTISTYIWAIMVLNGVVILGSSSSYSQCGTGFLAGFHLPVIFFIYETFMTQHSVSAIGSRTISIPMKQLGFLVGCRNWSTLSKMFWPRNIFFLNDTSKCVTVFWKFLFLHMRTSDSVMNTRIFYILCWVQIVFSYQFYFRDMHNTILVRLCSYGSIACWFFFDGLTRYYNFPSSGTDLLYCLWQVTQSFLPFNFYVCKIAIITYVPVVLYNVIVKYFEIYRGLCKWKFTFFSRGRQDVQACLSELCVSVVNLQNNFGNNIRKDKVVWSGKA